MTNTEAAAVLEAQATALGIHSKACREGTAEMVEIYSEGCAVCAPLIAGFIDWEMNDTERAIERMNDYHAEMQTALDAAGGRY